MATDNPKRKTHRDLIESACLYFAEQERRKNPDLSMNRALARGVRRFASQIQVSRENVNYMRRVNRVASWHWSTIEQATGGHIKKMDFEQASHG